MAKRHTEDTNDSVRERYLYVFAQVDANLIALIVLARRSQGRLGYSILCKEYEFVLFLAHRYFKS